MGSAYRFKCIKCDYSADVCGGTDIGFNVELKTQICDGCQELVDIVIYDFSFSGNEPEDLIEVCPKCKSKDTIDWEPNHPCPKCGKPMIADESVFINWD
jgi:hypothetical protein